MADKTLSDLIVGDAPAAPPKIKLSEIRAKFPMYSDMSDDQLLSGIRQKFYPDIPMGQFAKRIDYDTQRAALDPTKDMSTPDKLLSMMGSGMVSALRAVGGGSLAEKFGFPATAEEAAQIDRPLEAASGTGG